MRSKVGCELLFARDVGQVMAEPRHTIWFVPSLWDQTEPDIKVFCVYVPGHETSEMGARSIYYIILVCALALNNNHL